MESKKKGVKDGFFLFFSYSLWAVTYYSMLFAKPIAYDINRSIPEEYEGVESFILEKNLFENKCLGPNGVVSEDYFYEALKASNGKVKFFYYFSMISRYRPLIQIGLVFLIFIFWKCTYKPEKPQQGKIFP
jgi:hypothetical protein